MRLKIRWKPYFSDTEYGMVGEIKAFSVVCHGSSFTLDPRLPDAKGVTLPSEEFREVDAAKVRADVLLEGFLKAFLADTRQAEPTAVGAGKEAS
ncbi:hypothetical protein [Nonomuraea endophytica]|uniref:Uncharacterized protein n=1 Tax=Nonomuraea endophytica TaxID=714136 RepID=A0A7W8A7V0_9ACTN|nr:hypothetical protein [Nonomuraea endophytica]MBB5079833.1 hypothetical protein [Nonomuraea endophytica]